MSNSPLVWLCLCLVVAGAMEAEPPRKWKMSKQIATYFTGETPTGQAAQEKANLKCFKKHCVNFVKESVMLNVVSAIGPALSFSNANVEAIRQNFDHVERFTIHEEYVDGIGDIIPLYKCLNVEDRVPKHYFSLVTMLNSKNKNRETYKLDRTIGVRAVVATDKDKQATQIFDAEINPMDPVDATNFQVALGVQELLGYDPMACNCQTTLQHFSFAITSMNSPIQFADNVVNTFNHFKGVCRERYGMFGRLAANLNILTGTPMYQYSLIPPQSLVVF
jgi:hypothetical protein